MQLEWRLAVLSPPSGPSYSEELIQRKMYQGQWNRQWGRLNPREFQV